MDPSDKTENIEWMARVLAGMLAEMRGGWSGRAEIIDANSTRMPYGHADLGDLDAAAVEALDKLTQEMGHQWRVRLRLRQRELWRESATQFPDPAELTRTRIVGHNGAVPDHLADQVIVQRTDTGAYYLVSTNDEETYVFPCDEFGVRSEASEISCVSGRDVTRAGAIRNIDAERADRLVTWNYRWALEDAEDEPDDPPAGWPKPYVPGSMDDPRQTCDYHDGVWGTDPACVRCTRDDGTPRPVTEPGLPRVRRS